MLHDGIDDPGGAGQVQVLEKPVFISYRRADTGRAANALANAFQRRIGRDQVFLDSSSIDLGHAVGGVIESAVRRSELVIPLLGLHWDVQRLHNPNDWVRREILLASNQGKRILPVLVDRDSGPAEAALPNDLRFLAGLEPSLIRQAYPEDFEDLAEAITGRTAALSDLLAVGVKRDRKSVDRLLRQLLPRPQQWSGNRDRLVELALAVLGRDDRLVFLAPARLESRPPGSAAVLITGSHVIVVDVDEDFLIHGEIRVPRSLVRRIEVVPTLPLFADVILHSDGRPRKLMGLFRNQAYELADHLR
jgi:hypothetical protein